MHAKYLSGVMMLALAACATQAPAPAPVPQAQACTEVGMASWYHGTARGHTSADELTAAHKTLPFGTMVRVTTTDTGRSVVVRINDRGPFGKGRVIDLSKAAASQLGMRQDGVTQVRLDVEGATDQACPLREARLTTG